MIITAEKLAQNLSLSPGTIKRWTQEGIIPCLRLSGKVVRFDPDEVEQALRVKAQQVNKRMCKTKPKQRESEGVKCTT